MVLGLGVPLALLCSICAPKKENLVWLVIHSKDNSVCMCKLCSLNYYFVPLVNLIFFHINISFNGEMSQKHFYEMGLTTIITFKI